MIQCVTYDNLHLTGRAFCSQFHLRYKCFLERQAYKVRSYNNKEYDQYDTPAAVYMVYQSPSGVALGASRLTPTHHHCMLRDLWPDMVAQNQMMESRHVWEGTRFCVDKDQSPELRKKIIHELVLSYIEFGLHSGITQIVGLMPKLVLRSVFRSAGVHFEILGTKMIDNVETQAASMDINLQQLLRVRQQTGINHSILNITPPEHAITHKRPRVA